MRIRDASFARSFDPCSSILTMHRRVKPRWWGAVEGIAAGQTCVSRKNQHRGRRGGRSAARRASLLERAAWCVRKGRRSRPSSLRGREGPGLVARTSQNAVAEVDRRRLTSNKLGYALQKGRQGRVNGGLARSERRWVKPSTGAASEGYVGVSGLNSRNVLGEVRTKTQGGTRVSSSGRPIAKSGESVAGPGL